MSVASALGTARPTCLPSRRTLALLSAAPAREVISGYSRYVRNHAPSVMCQRRQ